MSNRSRGGKNKSIRRGFLDYTTQNRGDLPQVLNTLATAPPSVPPSTQKPKLQPHPTTAVTGETKSTKSKKKVPKQTRCCGSRMPVEGDTFKPRCKSCLKNITRTAEQNTLETAGSTATLATTVTTKQRTSASLLEDGKTDKRVYSSLLWNTTSQEHIGSTIAQIIHAERGLKKSRAMHNVTGGCLLLLTLSLLLLQAFEV